MKGYKIAPKAIENGQLHFHDLQVHVNCEVDIHCSPNDLIFDVFAE